MRFHPWFDASTAPAQRRPTRRAWPPADRRREARRLLLEGLEDRRLMAFNVLAEYATNSYPLDVALTQIDAGSQLDMVVADYYDGTVGVRLGNADGTFSGLQSSATGLYPQSVASGDLTGDGIPDLVTANSTDVSLLVGNGDGTFGAPLSTSLPPRTAPGNSDPTPLSQSPLSVATGDLNGDGTLDLVVVGDTYWYYCPYYCYGYRDAYVNVLLGNGTGGFAAPVVHHLGTNYYPSSVAVGDVNGDTKPDVITANSGYYSGLSVLLNVADEPGELALGSPQHSGSGYGQKSISLGDVDGDGKVDTVLGGGNAVYVQKGNGDGTFTAQPSLNTGHRVDSAVIGDVNGDGKMDLVAAGADNQYHCDSYGYYWCYYGSWTSTRHATVLLGNGEGSFAVPLTSVLGSEQNYSYFADLAIADLTGDDLPDLVAIDPYFNKAIVAANDGDWDPPPSISISDADLVVEGDTDTINAVFTVSIVGDHDGVSIDYWMADYTATAGSDYTASSGTLTFGIGVNSQTISVPVHGDIEDESDEQFFVHLSSPVGGQVTDGTGIATIQDDDTAPLFSILDAPTLVEGDGGTLNAVFTVTLEGERKGGIASVDYSTFDSSATAGADYTATAGTLTFGVNETSKEISVPILGDTIDEYDEQFYVSLFNPVAAQIETPAGLGTIEDDDAAPLVTIGDVSKNEGQQKKSTAFVFTVSLSAVSGKWVSMNFSTANGTATVADGDYDSTSGTVTIEPGQLTTTITVIVRGDKKKEANETFFVNLSGAIDGTISDAQGLGTIVNDEGGAGKGKNQVSLAKALLLDDTLTKARKRK